MTPRLRMAVIVVLLAHFALALRYSLYNPLGEAPDEADHWAYVVYLAQERSLPVGPTLTQAKHPFLYFAGAALFASLGEPVNDFFQPNPALNLQPGVDWSPNFFKHGAEEQRPWQDGVLAYHLSRLWSLLLSTLTVAATFVLGRASFSARPLWALAAAGVLAFTPEFLFIAGSLNNDNGAALMGALVLWGGMAIYRSGGRFAAAWWTPIALGAGFLVKVSTVALWPVIGLAIALGVWCDARQAGASVSAAIRRVVVCGGLVFIPALLMILPWLVRNLRLYGDLMGMNMAIQTIDVRTTPWSWADTEWLLQGWFISFWGKFGGAGHIPMAGWVYSALTVAAGISLIGLTRLWLRSDWRGVRIPLLLLGLAVLTTAIGIWRYSLIALGTDQGRLLYPAASALIALFAAGLLTWIPDRWQGWATWGLILLFVGLGVYGLWGVVLPALM
jgi:hypothetical protein